MHGIDTRLAFTTLVALIAVVRLGELALARGNVAWMLRHGGRELGARHYPAMVAVHTALLLGAPAEVWLLGRAFQPALAAAMLAALVAAMALRLWVIATLGRRWCTRVVVLPGAAPVTWGPYRFMRHPNYLAVVLEIAALPLVHGAWLTALLASLANAAVLRARLRVEDPAVWGRGAVA